MKMTLSKDDIQRVEPIKIPIAVCFRRGEADRWEIARDKLKKITSGKVKISDYARGYMMDMLERLEGLIAEYEAKTPAEKSEASFPEKLPLPFGRAE